MMTISEGLINECRKRLLSMKMDLMNRARQARHDFQKSERVGGDEIDQSVAFLAEHNFLISQDRLRHQLLEIEYALSRIESGNFGVCEETLEPIETERLLAIPYTRLSIEGVEIREASRKKYAGL